MKQKTLIISLLLSIFFSSCDWYLEKTMPNTRISGVIIDENNNPLENTYIQVLNYSSFNDYFIVVDSAFTNSEGRYEIEHKQANMMGEPIYSVFPYKIAYIPLLDYDNEFKRPIVRAEYGKKNEIDIVMKSLKKTTIHGIISDKETGDKVENVKISIFYKERKNTGERFYIDVTTYTNENGSYSIDFYNYSYLYYFLKIEKEEYLDNESEITIEPEQEGEVNIELEKY